MKKDLLENIRLQFKRLMFAGETCSFTTSDGKNIIVMGADIAPGVEVYEIDSDNNQTPLANGEITLVDGRKIIITDNKVETITAPSAEEMPMEPTTVEEMAEETITDTIETTDSMEATDVEKRISELEMKIEELYNMLQGSMTKTEDMVKCNLQMSEQIKVLSGEPATISHKPTKTLTTTKDSEKFNTIENIKNLVNKKNSFNIGSL